MNTLEMVPLEREELLMPLPVRMAGKTHQGLVREDNQDTWWASDAGHFAMVADGMGGHDGGGLASKAAVEAVTSHLETHPEVAMRDVAGCLRDAFDAAFDAIEVLASEDPELSGMGTTLVCAVISGPRELAVAHLGDSRLYRLRGTALSCLTEDHTVLSELLRAGVLSEARAQENHRLGHLLTRAISPGAEERPDLFRARLQPGDRYLLCSDGLHGVVSESQIIETLSADLSEEAICAELIDAALERGAPDNVTAVVLAFDTLSKA